MKPLILLLFLGLSVIAYQRTMPPRTVVVRGAMMDRIDTAAIFRHYNAAFTRQPGKQRAAPITDASMPLTGHYKVRLAAGQLYRIALNYGTCNVETQEFIVSDNPTDSVLTKNFYLSYTDTISFDHSSCLTKKQK